MRIVHFLSSTGHGGDALAALALARGQMLSGEHVEIVIGRSEHSAAFVNRAKDEGVNATEANDLPLTEHVPVATRVRRWRTVMSARAPDVLHLHTGGLAVRAADVLGSRLVPARARVATVHWPFPWEAGSTSLQRRWRILARALDRVIVPGSTARAQQLTAGLAPSRVVALPNAIDVERLAHGDGARVRRELGITDHPLVLFLARLEPQKRPLDAIVAFAEVATQVPRARMAIVGNGNLEAPCKELVRTRGLADRITFLGYRTDVADLMAAADVYVLPTEHESFGITLVEAMAAGAAVVTSRIAPLDGEVIPDGCASLVPVGDVEGLARAMLDLVRAPDRRRAMTERARKEVTRRYALLVVARRHLELYDACARPRRSLR